MEINHGHRPIDRLCQCYISVWAPKDVEFFCSQNPHLKMDSLTTAELWTIMEAAFIRQRNITFDSYVLLTTKQTRGESIEHLFGKLNELSENCELGSQEDALIRNLFIANLLDPEIQRELLRETLEPAQAIRLAINMELGQKINYNLQTRNLLRRLMQ